MPPPRTCIALQVEHPTIKKLCCIHPLVVLVGAAVIAPPLLALGPVILSGVHRLVAPVGPVLVVVIIAAVVPGNTFLLDCSLLNKL